MNTDFILALFQHGYKARISTLYHLLKGKRSSSVLLYGFLYNHLRFIEFDPDLQESDYNQSIATLNHNELLTINYQNEAQITEKGILELNKKEFSLAKFPWVDNYRYGKKDDKMFRMLQFSVQVASNLSYDNKRYVPIEHSPMYQMALKKWLVKRPKKEFIRGLKQEWLFVFESIPETEALYFVKQFSGYNQVGKTATQVLESSYSDLHKKLLRQNYLHHLLLTIQQNSQLPLLQDLISGPVFQNDNQSVQETKRYLENTTNPEVIAQKRNLKSSTIRDHLLELSFFEDVPFDVLINEETAKHLEKYTQQPYQEWSYSSIKQLFPTLDYFEFRLYQVQSIRKERGE